MTHACAGAQANQKERYSSNPYISGFIREISMCKMVKEGFKGTQLDARVCGNIRAVRVCVLAFATY